MPIEIINTASYTGAIHVWHCADCLHPSVSISSGVFSACLKPQEARALADKLIQAANAATSPQLPTADVREVA